MSSPVAAKLQLCYNRGCAKEYDPAINTEESCTFHPGVPVFHDAFKAWSCCENKKKCRDFTEFLNIKGCTTSKHSDIKPIEPEKPKEENKEKVNFAPRVAVEELPRPSEDVPMKCLKVTILPSLTQALAAQQKNKKEQQTEAVSNGEVKSGTACTNSGCKRTYEGESSELELCMYHTGVPVFHEGMKYWSCCRKKTSDFTNFLEQIGCTAGNHQWTKKVSDVAVTCRYDWHQTGSHVYLSVYAKNPIPSQTSITANPVKLAAHIIFDQGVFDLDFVLQGVISVDESVVTLGAAKIEIKMKKAQTLSWSALTVPIQETSILATGDVDLSEVDILPQSQVSLGDLDFDDLSLQRR